MLHSLWRCVHQGSSNVVCVCGAFPSLPCCDGSSVKWGSYGRVVWVAVLMLLLLLLLSFAQVQQCVPEPEHGGEAARAGSPGLQETPGQGGEVRGEGEDGAHHGQAASGRHPPPSSLFTLSFYSCTCASHFSSHLNHKKLLVPSYLILDTPSRISPQKLLICKVSGCT